MSNNLKHKTTINKKSTTTKLLTTEYAVVNENGEVQATTDYQTAVNELKKGKQVFMIKTYKVRTSTKLKGETENGKLS